MNADSAVEFAARAPLPLPTRERWQPLRIGLVELFHYDCEEFWFRDGHLLLRGNNGTGKSKVLSLTLPFLLDASLMSARVEPDGDRGKRMEWNLLLGRHERRLGYSWIELGRVDEQGEPCFLTLGCGMQAVAGRPRVESWNFITSQRVGEDLSLISPRRTALSRDALNEALGDRGRIFETAREYRRAVDERLFRLGEERYGSLIDTLIQLRQPQLSRKPDERSLSEALTSSLPEMPRVLLEDVAEAMSQLNAYRDELAEIESVLAAVRNFERRYRVYAQIQARRQARVLRKAQTEYDNRSRELHEAAAQVETSQAAVQQHDARAQALDAELRRQRARLDELLADPAMADARRLADLEQQTRTAEKSLSAARQRREVAAHHVEREEGEQHRRAQQLEAARREVERCDEQASDLAKQTALFEDLQFYKSKLVAERMSDEAADALARGVRESVERRRGQLSQIRRRIAAHEDADRRRAAAYDRSQYRRAALEQTESAARAAHKELDAHAAQLIAAFRAYLRGLRVMVVGDPEGPLTDLQSWVETLSGEQPVLTVLDGARSLAEAQLSSERTELEHRDATLQAEEKSLRVEIAELQAGNQPEPPPLPTRAVALRKDRPGAPLWKLLEFHAHVSDADRAGLEAALEGSGLLDAWVMPTGEVFLGDESDAFLQLGLPRSPALAAWIGPAEQSLVDRSVIETIVAAIGCGSVDEGGADTWVSPRGEFRIGRLHGRFHKTHAQYVGWAAREAARARRLAELEGALEAVSAERAELRGRLAHVTARREQLAEELRTVPKDDALRGAHAHYAAAEVQRRKAQAELAVADAQLEHEERAVRDAHEALACDARDLQLPTDREALSALERVLHDYSSIVQQLRSALVSRNRCFAEVDRQLERCEKAHGELADRAAEALERARELEDCSARLELLRETALAAVNELQRKLSEAKAAVSEIDGLLDRERGDLSTATARHAAAEQRRTDALSLLEERSVERKSAAERLQGFASTGLLALALADLELPERPNWSVDASLNLARRVEERLARVSAEDSDWARIQAAISQDYTALGQALSALGQRAEMEQSDFGMLVRIIHRNRAERPDVLERLLSDEIEERRSILTAREREILENHLQAEVAAHLQRLLRDAESRVQRINDELKRRPTSTGVYFKLDWEPLPEGDEGAPVGLSAARTRLLRRDADAWSSDDRRVVGELLQARIASERANDDTSPMVDHLARALDYRRWHAFKVKRWHDGAFRPLSGPASSGERALGLTVPLFAAASSHYESADSRHAPRLVLLDEAFAGIDDEARAHCMALIREFDLDFVMTSEREWGCYATLPGVAICQIVRREGIDGIFVSRWTWDGRARRGEPDPTRRFATVEDDE